MYAPGQPACTHEMRLTRALLNTYGNIMSEPAVMEQPETHLYIQAQILYYNMKVLNAKGPKR